MVALSMEILAPMDQLGWARAWAGVIAAISAMDLVRNGPPEAVRMILVTLARWSKSNTWKMALCSESTGSSVALWRATAAMNRSPADTRHSLLASATVAPRSTAARVG